MESLLSRKVEMVVDLQFNLHYTFIATFTRLMLDGRWEGHACLFFLSNFPIGWNFRHANQARSAKKIRRQIWAVSRQQGDTYNALFQLTFLFKGYYTRHVNGSPNSNYK